MMTKEEVEQIKDSYLNLRANGKIEESIHLELKYMEERTKLIRSNIKIEVVKFNPLKLKDIKAEPTEIVCKDFLPLIKGAYNLITGAGGVGKSTVALRSCMHYLRANPKARAFLAMGEDDSLEVSSRIDSIGCDFMGMDLNGIANIKDRMDFTTVDNPIQMRFLESSIDGAKINTELVASFESYLKDNKIEFVVLDPLKKFHSVNENSNSEMDLLVRDVFLELAGRLNIVLTLLHHSSKSADSNGSRGASTISDTSRIAYKLSKKYVKDKESGELIEDKAELGNVKVSTIKDNKNIFSKYGYRNTNDGIIQLYRQASQPFEIEYDMGENNVNMPII